MKRLVAMSDLFATFVVKVSRSMDCSPFEYTEKLRIFNYLTMDKQKFFALFLTIMVGFVPVFAQHRMIEEAVERQMKAYPKSTLRDLYKNFFQDNFGPGHLLSNPEAAENYLRSELESADSLPGPYYEPTGFKGNFYRVNLSVIADGIMTFDEYFDAFSRSMREIEMMPVEEWKKEWSVIDSVIGKLDLGLENVEADRCAIDSLLDKGEYVVHHSKVFEDTYSPHYRIIGKKIFENEILPKIQSSGVF